MKLTEFRIGNLINTEWGVYPVSEICDSYLRVRRTKESLQRTPDTVSAVPLTEDMFYQIEDIEYESENLHLSFCKIDVKNEYNFTEEQNPTEYKFILFINGGLGDVSSYAARIEIKYVHIIQNIWFTLTGEELPIK